MKITALQMPPVRTQLAPTNANAILGSKGTDTSARISMNARAESILVANMHHVWTLKAHMSVIVLLGTMAMGGLVMISMNATQLITIAAIMQIVLMI